MMHTQRQCKNRKMINEKESHKINTHNRRSWDDPIHTRGSLQTTYHYTRLVRNLIYFVRLDILILINIDLCFFYF